MNYRLSVLTAIAAASVLALSACSSSSGTTDAPSATNTAKTTAGKPANEENEEIGTMAQGGECTYKAQVAPIYLSHKGKGGKGNGETKKDGRVLILSTGKVPDYSAARLSGKTKKGDRVWVDISHDKGKNWKGCGGTVAGMDKAKFHSKWYVHSSNTAVSVVKNRVMRACARTTTNGKRTTWCATVGDVKTDGRYWWTD